MFSSISSTTDTSGKFQQIPSFAKNMPIIMLWHFYCQQPYKIYPGSYEPGSVKGGEGEKRVLCYLYYAVALYIVPGYYNLLLNC